jgi:hypothetical protein
MKTILYNMGHRGAFLFLLGLSYILYGSELNSILIGVNSTLILTLHQWVFVWIVSGGLIIAGSFGRGDRCAFSLAAFIAGWWSAQWAWLWIVHGNNHVWPISALWAIVACIVLLISTWPEYGVRPKIERDRE